VDETIFMIHGMWVGPWFWDNYIDLFAQAGYHCVATTLRFHDMDPADAPDPRLGATSLLDYAEDLEQEIRALGCQPIIMGHSMGGLLAQIMGSRGLAKALVLLGPAPPAGNRMLLQPSVMRSFWSGQTRWAFWRRPFRQTFEEAVYSMLHLLPIHEQRETYGRLVYESGRAASEIGYWFLDPKRAAQVEESDMTCPVLVVGASEDRITPVPIVRWVARQYKAVSTYKEFANQAHWLVAQPGWPDVAEYVASWLEGTLADIG
jgi:pimeloyl-ACP methyl ester carboxylesterase